MGKSHLLRILIDESDWWRDSLLYEAILTKAKKLSLETPCVLYGIMGFGWNRRIRRRRQWIDLFGLTQRSPIAVEIADNDHRLATLLPFVEEAVSEGLITLEECDLFQSSSTWREREGGSFREEVADLARFGRSATRLRVHFRPSGESDNSSLHDALVQKARDMELMGATVFPDVGPDDKTELLNLPTFVQSRNSRLIAEFVDDSGAIERFAHIAREMAPAATLETTEVRFVRPSNYLKRNTNGWSPA